MSLNLFGNPIPLYGILFWVGVFVAAGVAILICRKRNLQPFDIVGSAVWVMIGAVVGAKLLFLLVSLPTIIQLFQLVAIGEYTFMEVFTAIMQGGFVFYGGFIGGAIGLVIYAWEFKKSLIDYLGIYATVVPLGHAFGRIGCFLAGCCHGGPFDGAFSVAYLHGEVTEVTGNPLFVIHLDELGGAPLGVPLFPVQLVEAILLLLLFGVLLFLFFKASKKRLLVPAVYVVSYAVIRFVLEFFRNDGIRGILLLSTSQWISVALVLAVAGLFIAHVVQKKKKAQAGALSE